MSKKNSYRNKVLSAAIAMFFAAPLYNLGAQAQGGFHKANTGFVQIQADKRVLAVMAQLEEIGLKGEIAGACGEGRIYSAAEKSACSKKQNELYALGPAVIPDMMKCINSDGYFSQAGVDWSRGGQHNHYQTNWIMNYPRGTCSQVLARYGTKTIDYICKSDIPANNERNLLVEEISGSIGPAASIRIAQLLKSKNPNERYWATQILNQNFSYLSGTAERENGEYARLLSRMPHKQIAADLSNSPVPENETERDHYLELLGHCSSGEPAAIRILNHYLTNDIQRNNRIACALALVEIAAQANFDIGRNCMESVANAFKNDPDAQVRDAIACNIGGGSFRISNDQYANERIQILKVGLNDANALVRDRCSSGLRKLKAN